MGAFVPAWFSNATAHFRKNRKKRPNLSAEHIPLYGSLSENSLISTFFMFYNLPTCFNSSLIYTFQTQIMPMPFIGLISSLGELATNALNGALQVPLINAIQPWVVAVL